MRNYIIGLTVLVMTLGASTSSAQIGSWVDDAQAEQTDQGEQFATELSGAVVVVLPEVYNVEEDVAAALFQQLAVAVTDHPALELIEVPPQNLEDLAFAVGCVEADTPECMELIGDVLYADYMIRGELEGTGGAFVVDVAVHDCFTHEVYNLYHGAIEADQETFLGYLPWLAKAPLYGPIGIIQLTYSPDNALVELDNQLYEGEGEIEIANLPLGPHVLRVSHPDYFVYRDVVMADSQPLQVRAELVPTTEEIDVGGGRLWTWVTLGAGVALAGTGVAFGLVTNSTQDTFDTEAARVNPNLAELEDLQDSGETQALLTNVFLGAGAALVTTGVVLFFIEGSGGDSTSSDQTALSIGPQVNDNGYGLQLDIEY